MKYIVYKQENAEGLNWFIRDNLGRVYGGFYNYNFAYEVIDCLINQGILFRDEA